MSIPDQLSDNVVSEPSLSKRNSEQTRAGYDDQTLSPTKQDRALVEETKSCLALQIDPSHKPKAKE